MNFFGIEVTDARFEAAMKEARIWAALEDGAFCADEDIQEALGFETGDVAAAHGDSEVTWPTKPPTHSQT